MQELGRNGTTRYLETMISIEVVGLLNPAPVAVSSQVAADDFGLD